MTVDYETAADLLPPRGHFWRPVSIWQSPSREGPCIGDFADRPRDWVLAGRLAGQRYSPALGEIALAAFILERSCPRSWPPVI